jgi:hypothetical protein
LLCRTLRVGDRPFASIEPMSLRFTWVPSAPEGALRLSPFACCRREGDAMVVESPLAPARVVLHDPRAALALGALATAPAHESSVSGLSGSAARRAAICPPTPGGRCWRCCGARGALEPAATDTTSPRPALAQWSFTISFHARARLGRPTGRGVDDSPRRRDRAAAGHQAPMSDERIRLARPDLDTLSERDMPLSRALETRRSIANSATRRSRSIRSASSSIGSACQKHRHRQFGASSEAVSVWGRALRDRDLPVG